MPEALRAVRAAAREALAAHVPPGSPVGLALSGGRDSVVLLDALLDVATERGHALAGFHVHHGLSANADAWARFCADLCAARAVPFTLKRVVVPRGPQRSVENEARTQRYAALVEAAAEAGVSFVALAHHRDDQAETLLLQLLRGAGPRGLSAMTPARRDRRGITWLRPLLEVPRTAIDAYAAAGGLTFVDDESNRDARYLRNAIRHHALPALAAIAPACAVTLARAAAHFAEVSRLADELAAIDAAPAHAGTTLDRAALRALPPHRARNLLRWFLRGQGLPPPSSARLAAMLDQLLHARPDAHVRIAHAGRELGLHDGRVAVHAPPPPAFDLPWCGEALLELPHGRLAFVRALGGGFDERLLALGPVRVRSRAGGERFQLAPDRPRRALKAILREARIPPWERSALPLVFCGETLVAVAALGIDAACTAPPGNPCIVLDWRR